MRFLIGLALGFGVGFAGAVLFAPERTKRREVDWPAATAEEVRPPAFEEDHNIMDSLKSALRSVREQVSEAMEEAKKAQAEAERELRERYAKKVQRDAWEPPKVEALKSKASVKRGKGK